MATAIVDTKFFEICTLRDLVSRNSFVFKDQRNLSPEKGH